MQKLQLADSEFDASSIQRTDHPKIFKVMSILASLPQRFTIDMLNLTNYIAIAGTTVQSRLPQIHCRSIWNYDQLHLP